MIRPLLILVNVLLIFIASSAVVLASYLAFTPSYITLFRAAEYEVDKNPNQKAQVNIIQVAVISMISLFFVVYVGAILGLAGAIMKDRISLGIYMVLLALLFVSKLVVVIYVAVNEPLNPFIPSIVKIYKSSFEQQDIQTEGKVVLWRKAIHKVQENFHCCSFKSITEYTPAVMNDDISASDPFPRSCCKTYDPDKNDFYDEDCYNQMIAYIRHVNNTRDAFRRANIDKLPDSSTFHNTTCLETVKSYLNKNKLFMILSFAILPFLLLIFLVCACIVCKKAGKDANEPVSGKESAIPASAIGVNQTVSGMRMQRATKSKSAGMYSRRDNDNLLENEDFI